MGSFVTLFRPGPAWASGRRLEKQACWAENLLYLRAQSRIARMRYIGPAAGHEGMVVALWYVESIEEARRLAREAPLVTSGVLREETAEGGLGH